jgi:mono/diheme cytochrome c family protein
LLRLLAFIVLDTASCRARRFPAATAVLALVVAFLSDRVAGGDEPTGAAIYQQKCARCHGKSGEGARAYPSPLAGKRSLPQLTRYMARSMPEDAPGTCAGPDAEKVAAYIFEAANYVAANTWWS